MAKKTAPYIGKTGKVDLDEKVFGEEFNMGLVHETARAELNARRAAPLPRKTRGEVSMTSAKAFRQKGTGRARAGALSTPNRYGGGVAFGPKPRQLHGQGQPQGAQEGAARGAVGARRPRLAGRLRSRRRTTTPSTKARRRGARPSSARAARWSSSAPTTRTAPRASATSRAWRSARPTTSAWPTSSARRA